jgi:hypothetical protein
MNFCQDMVKDNWDANQVAEVGLGQAPREDS